MAALSGLSTNRQGSLLGGGIYKSSLLLNPVAAKWPSPLIDDARAIHAGLARTTPDGRTTTQARPMK
ncbi:MAG: hypothetical protein RI986_824 [Planctomycetota bacterium]